MLFISKKGTNQSIQAIIRNYFCYISNVRSDVLYCIADNTGESIHEPELPALYTDMDHLRALEILKEKPLGSYVIREEKNA